MLAVVLLIAFFIGVVVAYVAGVRQGAGWGNPVLVLCTLGLVGVALLRAFGGFADDPSTAAPLDLRHVAGRAEALGSLLKGKVVPASGDRIRILILTGMGQLASVDRLDKRIAWKKGFDKALGPDGWERIGEWGPAPGYADDLSDSLDEHVAKHGENIDAVVSFAGLPEDLEYVSFYDWESPPKVVGLFSLQTADLGAIRTWLEDGYLMAAIAVDSESKARTYTPLSLPDVP